MAKTIDALIVFEHSVRELESVLWLKIELERRGLTSEVVQYAWNEGPSRLRYRPKVLIVPWCYDDVDYDYFSTYKGGFNDESFVLINLHSEQLTNENGIKFMTSSGKSKDVYHFVWGEYYKEILERNKVDPKLIYKTGSCRLDLFKKEYSSLSKSKKELADLFKLDYEKRWIILVGNFGINPLEQINNSLEDRGVEIDNECKSIVKNSYLKIIDWYKKACENDSVERECELIYRPHPSESLTSNIRELSDEYSCFHIIPDYSIRDWFVNADVVYSWTSTSSVEAAVAGVPVYSLRPYEMPDRMKVTLLESVKAIKNEQDFVDSIVRKEYSDVNTSLLKEIPYYYYNNNKPVVETICDLIETELRSETGIVKSRWSMWFGLHKGIKYCIKKVMLFFHISPRNPKRKVYFRDYIPKKRMLEDLRIIERVVCRGNGKVY
ncbi:MAG: hypothetical protein J5819_10185 [Eubacterium sp.]|nr:hypothetical protein [Eubacterium sp.]